MGLFGNKKATAPLTPEYVYDDVVDYLRDLLPADYVKILKVVNTYREADKKVKKILNIKASDDGFTKDELDEIFLIDEPAEKPKTKKAAKK